MLKKNDFLVEKWTDEDLMERVRLPRVWETLENGIEIQELQPSRYEEVLTLIKRYYIVEEPLLSGCQFHLDKESVEQFEYLCHFWMKDSLSSVAIDMKSGDVVGFLICRFNELNYADDMYSEKRVLRNKKYCPFNIRNLRNLRHILQIYRGFKWIELQKFKYFLMTEGNPYEYFNIQSIFQVYLWFVISDFRGHGIGIKLLENVAYKQLPEYEWFESNVITGIFTSRQSQDFAESIGMTTLYEFMYAGWIAKNEEEEEVEFFSEMQSGNYAAKLMGMRVGSILIENKNDISTDDKDRFESSATDPTKKDTEN
ncbi:uncharacterized protein LOC126897985 [Daktulosphaira vitifoliae]|uniref:uncharacterized protein LOC126897985 n=1 Tax=Daktulosphaira vitifoliae TaxID=58002 RepID=UPI0021AACD17|nr:uncharacterized protein LOC126897985 [Daktulosphaira vitifoliae]